LPVRNRRQPGGESVAAESTRSVARDGKQAPLCEIQSANKARVPIEEHNVAARADDHLGRSTNVSRERIAGLDEIVARIASRTVDDSRQEHTIAGNARDRVVVEIDAVNVTAAVRNEEAVVGAIVRT